MLGLLLPCRDPRWGRGQETPGEGTFHPPSLVVLVLSLAVIVLFGLFPQLKTTHVLHDRDMLTVSASAHGPRRVFWVTYPMVTCVFWVTYPMVEWKV